MRSCWFVSGLLVVCSPLPAQRLAVGVSGAVIGLSETSYAPGSLIQVTVSYSVPVQTLPRTVLTLRAADSKASFELPQYPQLPSSVRVWSIIPRDAPIGFADLSVTADGWEPASQRLFISRSNFGILLHTAQQYEGGRATLNQFTAPARPGMAMTVWGTGLGLADPGQVVVRVSDLAVRPEFAGPAPGQPGLDQINFVVPDDGAIPDDCYVPVVVEAAGQVSNAIAIAVDRAGKTCRHPLGLSGSQLATLDGGGRTRVAHMLVYSYSGPGGGGFYRNDYAELSARSYAIDELPRITSVYEPVGQRGCSVGSVWAMATGYNPPTLDAGTVLGQDPNGMALQFQPSPGDQYQFIYNASSRIFERDKVPSAPFSGGTWSISATGGSDLGPLKLTFDLPPPLTWTNRDQIQLVKRGEDLTVTWDSKGYGLADRVWLFASVRTAMASGPAASRTVGCEAAATDGTIRLPASLLAALPGAGTPNMVSLGLYAVKARELTPAFTATSHGETITGTIDYSFGSGISVPIE